jgi:E3 ubiquitin-protein ligase NEDD4
MDFNPTIYAAVVTVDGEQTHTTTVMKKTLNPYWNESFDL